MSPSIHGPPALLPNTLRELCSCLLPRLNLIPELKRWLPDTISGGYTLTGSPIEPVKILWNCLVLGTPLLTLLDLLGPKTGAGSASSSLFPTTEDLLPEEISDVPIVEFLRRVELLEAQGHLGYGEIFRVNELLDGSCSGFMKVLRTVQRVLNCLEATYPCLYELPDRENRKNVAEQTFKHFRDDEVMYLANLQKMADCVATIGSLMTPTPIILECLEIYLQRIISYQTHVTVYLQTNRLSSTDSVIWNELFALKNDLQLTGTGAYQSYCTKYPAMVIFLDDIRGKKEHETLYRKCTELSLLLSCPIKHVLSYINVLSAALEITHPIETPIVFSSLCTAHLRFSSLANTLLEVSLYMRTAQAVQVINQRAFLWNGPDVESLGQLLLDDCVSAEFCNPISNDKTIADPSGTDGGLTTGVNSFLYAFLFERMLLLCRLPDYEEGSQNTNSLSPLSDICCQYPIERWDLGPALRADGLLSVFCSIELSDIIHICQPASGELSFDIDWTYRGLSCTLTLHCYELTQIEQWFITLSRLRPNDSVQIMIDNDDEPRTSPSEVTGTVPWHDELDFSRHRVNSKPKPWSLIARKDGTPSSSIYQFVSGSEPSLISWISSPKSRTLRFEVSTSPRSLSPIHSQMPLNVEDVNASLITSNTDVVEDIEGFLDLTGKIKRTGEYPAAHGGFADVWKCEWIIGPECRKVAVKVLRGILTDLEREDKMLKRLQREIKVWQQFDHENVIPLYGTCSDFGRYVSLVCPWYDNGSAHQYLMKHGDKLQLHDRLKLLSEIASGLAYLHSFSIVHGDLSSSNVLINDQKKACLCDFGLSTFVEDFMGPSYPSSILGGAIRWAAPELFYVPDRDQPYMPQLSTSSDVYSYGSLTLEILSGKIPYYYLKHDGQVLIELSKKVKPNRTPSPFLTNELWNFIGKCWDDIPSARPPTADVSMQMLQLHQRSLARHSI